MRASSTTTFKADKEKNEFEGLCGRLCQIKTRLRNQKWLKKTTNYSMHSFKNELDFLEK